MLLSPNGARAISSPEILAHVEPGLTGSSIAADRAWFTEYTPFKTYALVNNKVKVKLEAVGIGNIDLTITLFRNEMERSTHVLHLRNVLHVPKNQCNIVGGVSTGDYVSYSLRMTEQLPFGAIVGKGGVELGSLARVKSLIYLQDIVPPAGFTLKSRLDEEPLHYGTYIIGAVWPDIERQRWEIKSGMDFPVHHAIPGVPEDDLYTEIEKVDIKERYGSELEMLSWFIEEPTNRLRGQKLSRIVRCRELQTLAPPGIGASPIPTRIRA